MIENAGCAVRSNDVAFRYSGTAHGYCGVQAAAAVGRFRAFPQAVHRSIEP